MKKYRLLYNFYRPNNTLDCNWYDFEAKNNKTAIMAAKTYCKEKGFFVCKIITGVNETYTQIF